MSRPQTVSEYQVRNDRFSPDNLDRGRPRRVEVLWYVVKCGFFTTRIPWPNKLQTWLLRLFGARIGTGVNIKPRVNIHFPWKLSIGDHCWVGEGTTILNMEPVTIGNHTALAHEVYIAAAGHDTASATMRFQNEPVVLEDQCWIASRTFIGPGSVVRQGTVVAPGSVVSGEVGPWTMVGGIPAKRLRPREITRP